MNPTIMVKFLHASDLHLGRFQYRNQARANDFIVAFEKLLILARSQKVDFILLGGDVFNSLELMPGIFTLLIKVIKQHQECNETEIPIIAIEGNHDIRKMSRGMRFKERGQSWLKVMNELGLIILLDGEVNDPTAEMFAPYNFERRSGGKIRIKEAIIYGTHYLGENPYKELRKIGMAIEQEKEPGTFRILLQHFGIEGQLGDVPGIDFRQVDPLRDTVDYLALGHFHDCFIIDDWVFNPGSTEAGCSADHSYVRGVFLVEINPSQNSVKKVKHVQLANRSHVNMTILLEKQHASPENLYRDVIRILKDKINHENLEVLQNDRLKPVLYLTLKGKPLSRACKINKKRLTERITKNIPVVDVHLQQQFKTYLTTLEIFI